MPRSAKKSVAKAVLLAYLLPLCAAALAGAVHAADHFGAYLDDARRTASAIGLTHRTDDATEPGRRSLRTAATRMDAALVHTHGGSTHSHGEAVDALRAAADEAGDQIEAAEAAGTVSSHVPVSFAVAESGPVPEATAPTASTDLPVGPTSEPPLRPPRA